MRYGELFPRIPLRLSQGEADPALADAILDARTEAEAWMAAKDETGYLLVVGRRP